MSAGDCPLLVLPELIKIRFIVQSQFDGWRLDHFIQARIPRLSRNRIQHMIRSQAALGGVVLRPSLRVRSGQEIVLLRRAPIEPDVPRTFGVLYRDEDMAAIDKPAGLPVHSTARFYKNTLARFLRDYFPKELHPTMAHRLDRETSGLMLIALTREASSALKRAFRERSVQKRYLAIVRGSAPDEGEIDLPLGPDIRSGIRIKMDIVASGFPSRTLYRTLERRGDFSLVEACPKTGRQHQIRAHFSAIGYPILGDKLYGQDPSVWLEYIETGWTQSLAERLLFPRQALHAAGARFPHPKTGEIMEIECPLAKELQDFWESLKT